LKQLTDKENSQNCLNIGKREMWDLYAMFIGTGNIVIHAHISWYNYWAVCWLYI